MCDIMTDILRRCDEIQKKQPCCHNDGRVCNCMECLRVGFFEGFDDTYDCLKKVCFYVMKYGPIYVSEIYHFLHQSKIIERFVEPGSRRTINILSLGCGFEPDYIALEKYINDKNLNISFSYIGIDEECNWQCIVL